jgi:VRR-NUC domain-containing protein
MLTEREFQRQVMDLAKILGWAAYHPWLSIRSEQGWPDLALVKPPRIILAELKREGGRVTPAQDRWLGMLRQCPGIEVYLWKPSDLDAIARCLGA